MADRKRKGKKADDLCPPVSEDGFLDCLLNVTQAAPEQFYIKRPPANILMSDFPDKVPNLYVPVMDQGILDFSAHLRALQKEYRRTKNGMYLVSAFLLTHETRYFPPLWVLDAMSAAFKAYWEKPQTESIEALLRLKSGRGQAPPYQSAARRARDYDIAQDMWLLIHKFGLTVEEAAEVAQGKLGLPSQRKIRWGESLNQTFSHDSLTKLYSTKWKKAFGFTKTSFDTNASNYSSKFWAHFISEFPTANLPSSLKAKLRSEGASPLDKSRLG